MSAILQLAFAELGTKEIPGGEHNARIVQYSTESGIVGINDDETYWCSVFVNWVAHKLDLPKTNKANARSWLNAGMPTETPQPGDVVVFWRGQRQSWTGHVGFFLGFNHDASRVFCLGGNQGDAVTIAEYDAQKVLGYRRLEKGATNEIPLPILKAGMQGSEVEKLQLWLNANGYNCGDPDGDFGPKTDTAFKNFQSDNHLTIDGIYGPQGQTALESITQT